MELGSKPSTQVNAAPVTKSRLSQTHLSVSVVFSHCLLQVSRDPSYYLVIFPSTVPNCGSTGGHSGSRGKVSLEYMLDTVLCSFTRQVDRPIPKFPVLL